MKLVSYYNLLLFWDKIHTLVGNARKCHILETEHVGNLNFGPVILQTNLNGPFSHSWPHDIVRYVPKASFLLDALTATLTQACYFKA